MAEGLTLEVIEGPDAGRQVALEQPIEIGRATENDLVLEDVQVSRHHAKVTPSSGLFAVVEDLGSVNGTFVNLDELHGYARLDAGDQLQVGVTVIQVRGPREAKSGVVAIPAGLARSAPQSAEVDAQLRAPESEAARVRVPELERYLDARVRRRAQLAPLALFALVALALIIYLATR